MCLPLRSGTVVVFGRVRTNSAMAAAISGMIGITHHGIHGCCTKTPWRGGTGGCSPGRRSAGWARSSKRRSALRPIQIWRRGRTSTSARASPPGGTTSFSGLQRKRQAFSGSAVVRSISIGAFEVLRATTW